LRWPRNPLYPQKLVLTSPTSGGHSVGIVRLRTTATEFSFFFLVCNINLFNDSSHSFNIAINSSHNIDPRFNINLGIDARHNTDPIHNINLVIDPMCNTNLVIDPRHNINPVTDPNEQAYSAK
jgi:hypothetical protein